MSQVRVPRGVLLSAVEHVYPLVSPKPLEDIFGGISLRVDPPLGLITAIATANGAVWARSCRDVAAAEIDGETFTHVLPGKKLVEILREIDADRIELDLVDSGNSVQIVGGGWHFAFPLYRNPAAFPELPIPTGEPFAEGIEPVELARALERCEYAMGTPDTDPSWRLITVQHGRAVAYGGDNAQEAVVAGQWAEGDELLPVTPELVSLLARFLRGSRAKETTIGAAVNKHERGVEEPAYVVTAGHSQFAFLAPRVQPRPVAGLWKYADKQRAKCSTLMVPKHELLKAAQAARIQGDPNMPVLIMDLPDDEDSPLRVSTSSVEGQFEYLIEQVSMSGGGYGKRVAVGVRSLIEMLEGSQDERIELLVYTGRPPANEGHALLQYTDSKDARALLPLVDLKALANAA